MRGTLSTHAYARCTGLDATYRAVLHVFVSYDFPILSHHFISTLSYPMRLSHVIAYRVSCVHSLPCLIPSCHMKSYRGAPHRPCHIRSWLVAHHESHVACHVEHGVCCAYARMMHLFRGGGSDAHPRASPASARD